MGQFGCFKHIRACTTEEIHLPRKSGHLYEECQLPVGFTLPELHQLLTRNVPWLGRWVTARRFDADIHSGSCWIAKGKMCAPRFRSHDRRSTDFVSCPGLNGVRLRLALQLVRIPGTHRDPAAAWTCPGA